MSYEFIKLNEVEKVDSSYNASLLIEQNGEIKRLSTENINFGGGGQQVQADWNEKDDTSPAYIMNKPEINGNIVYISLDCGGVFSKSDGTAFTVNELKELWKSGARIRFDFNWRTEGEYGSSEVIGADLSDYTGCNNIGFYVYRPYTGVIEFYHIYET